MPTTITGKNEESHHSHTHAHSMPAHRGTGKPVGIQLPASARERTCCCSWWRQHHDNRRRPDAHLQQSRTSRIGERQDHLAQLHELHGRDKHGGGGIQPRGEGKGVVGGFGAVHRLRHDEADRHRRYTAGRILCKGHRRGGLLLLYAQRENRGRNHGEIRDFLYRKLQFNRYGRGPRTQLLRP